MDNLVEQVVKKEKNTKYYINLSLIIFALIAIPTTFFILGFVVTPYLIYVSFFSLLFCIYGAWYFITSLRVEYEYAFLSSILRIDKVISKRKRRPVVKVDVKTFDDFFPYSDEKLSERKYAKIYYAGAREFSPDNYVASYHSEAKGRTAIIFTPNEKLIDAMKPYFGAEMKKKLYKERRL